MANNRKQFEAEDYEPVDIDKWDQSQVKNALDDTIKKFVTKQFGYKENFRIFDEKLLICTIACLFSLLALVYDYLYPFPESKYILATCSISPLFVCLFTYFVLMGVFSLFTSYRERKIFMVAVEEDEAGLNPENFWYFASSLPRFNDIYTIRAEFYNGKTKTTTSVEREESVANWIDEDNAMVYEKFYKFFEDLHKETREKKTQ